MADAIQRQFGNRVEARGSQPLEDCRRGLRCPGGEPSRRPSTRTPDTVRSPATARAVSTAVDGDVQRIRLPGHANLARRERHRVGERLVERTAARRARRSPARHGCGAGRCPPACRAAGCRASRASCARSSASSRSPALTRSSSASKECRGRHASIVSATRVASASASRPSRPVTPGRPARADGIDEVLRARGAAARRW